MLLSLPHRKIIAVHEIWLLNALKVIYEAQSKQVQVNTHADKHQTANGIDTECYCFHRQSIFLVDGIIIVSLSRDTDDVHREKEAHYYYFEADEAVDSCFEAPLQVF